MKNIHVLPTDKPSRLSFDFDEDKYLLTDDLVLFDNQNLLENRNIYITSDEEIKDGDWCLHKDGKGILCKVNLIFENGDLLLNNATRIKPLEFKKIILTTDQDLIKDGVQEINDEFLEWFVKNPTCEFVKIERFYKMSQSEYNGIEYKIIIQKEEPKQECECTDECLGYLTKECKGLDYERTYQPISLSEVDKEEPKFEDSIENSLSIMSIANNMFGKKESKQETLENDVNTQEWGFENFITSEEDAKIFIDAMIQAPEPSEKLKQAFKNFHKQETLEEAAEKEFPLINTKFDKGGVIEEENLQLLGHRRSFIKGAKWMEERMYSEEEVGELVYNIIGEYGKYYGIMIDGSKLNELFEQFKKK